MVLTDLQTHICVANGESNRAYESPSLRASHAVGS